MQLAESLRVLMALSVVLGLLGLAALAARRFGLTAAGAGFVRQKRLALIETLPLDAKRRAAIIRCDGAEHLIVLNPNGATVIARNIGAPPMETGDLAETPQTASPHDAPQTFGETFRQGVGEETKAA